MLALMPACDSSGDAQVCQTAYDDCNTEMADFEDALGQDSGEPASCTTLYEKCPGLQD